MLLKFAIQDFKDDREYRNLSPKAIESYLLTLQEFQSFCAEQEILNVHEVRQGAVKSYLSHCQKERDNNPTTRNSKLHTLKIFFNYIEEIEVIESRQNSIKRLAYVKEDIKIETFTDHQIQQILNYHRRVKEYTRSYVSYRNYTMIIYLLGTGARLGEMINTWWSDVDLKNRAIVLYGKKRE